MALKERSQHRYHIKTILDKMKTVNKWQHDLLQGVLMLSIGIKERLNFLQLSRYGVHGEQHHRGHL